MKKKIIVMSILILMLALTGYLNYVGDNSDNEKLAKEEEYIPIGEALPVSAGNTDINNSDYFKKAKIDKEAQRAQTIDLLNDIVNNPNSGADAKADAENMLTRIADNILIENTAEGLIMAKGYNNAVVYIDEASVNVIVSAVSLTAEDTAKIRDIVYEQTNNNNIKIVAVN